MQFTILIYETEDGFQSRHDANQKDDYWAGTMLYVKAIRESGHLIAGAGLDKPETAANIIFEKGKAKIEDGPVPETKEQLGGFFVIEVESLDAALKWAARFPQRPGVRIEVRPNLKSER